MFFWILVLPFLIIFLSIYYYFERKYTKNERKKHSEWNNPDSSFELSQKKSKFLLYVKGRFIIFSCVILLMFYLLDLSEKYITDKFKVGDEELEKRSLEEYNLFKEDAILLGRWEPADSSIRNVNYRFSRCDVLIYMKNELYFIEYNKDRVGFTTNYIQQGIDLKNGDAIIFTTHSGDMHIFYPETLTFEDDTYVRED
jgi:hypothetical protein